MANFLKFSIVTPDQVVYEDEISQATIPTKVGEITVLANHTPLVSTLSYGELRIKKSSGEEVGFAVSQGVIEVRPGSELIVLTNFALHAREIDIAEAEKARARAEEILKDEEALSKEDFAHFETSLMREIAKIKTGRRWLK